MTGRPLILSALLAGTTGPLWAQRSATPFALGTITVPGRRVPGVDLDFPTLFERFSARFGGATSNPGLGEERATQAELSGGYQASHWRAEGAVFVADVTDAIVAVPALFYPCTGSTRPADIAAFLWAEWEPVTQLFLLPGLDIAGDRWVVDTVGTQWRRDGAHALVNVRVAWRPRAGIELAASANNLGDSSYQLAEGFPEAGRNFRLSVRARY